jgi:SAM-dependent methyltransferase
VCLFDCLHDMGDPVRAARSIRRALAPDGTLLLVEPLAGDGLEDNLNPVGRIFYGLSTVICTPASLTHVRRAAATPFNLILEARP